MTDKDREDLDERDMMDEDMDEDMVVVMTDEDGNEFYYREEMIIPLEDKRYAILVPVDLDEDDESDAECCCDEDSLDVYIARIDTDEHGEEVYVDPTDEEFDQVRHAYEELMEREEI